jgi:hypothetical protein
LLGRKTLLSNQVLVSSAIASSSRTVKLPFYQRYVKSPVNYQSARMTDERRQSQSTELILIIEDDAIITNVKGKGSTHGPWVYASGKRRFTIGHICIKYVIYLILGSRKLVGIDV